MSLINTIGYGNRKIYDFLHLLQRFNIEVLVDIRSNPVSRFQPHYSKNRLSDFLENKGIIYIFMGDVLGGKPKNDKYYVNGVISYELVREHEAYKNAITELVKLSENKRLCLMCCELKPDICHRKDLVGVSLRERGLKVSHIDEKGLILAS